MFVLPAVGFAPGCRELTLSDSLCPDSPRNGLIGTLRRNHILDFFCLSHLTHPSYVFSATIPFPYAEKLLRAPPHMGAVTIHTISQFATLPPLPRVRPIRQLTTRISYV